MHFFAVLCLLATTRADLLGDDYQPADRSEREVSLTPGSNIISGAVSGHLRRSVGGGLGSLGGGGSSHASGIVDIDDLGGKNDIASHRAPAELVKEFYTFSAPESEFNSEDVAQKIVGHVKQSIRVIFIKSPENNGIENAALSLAKHIASQKTVIYVLSQQADATDLAHKLNAIRQSSNSKPEVHFVKYRTPEDVTNAQKAIQTQYDSFRDHSQAHKAVLVPVLDFASQAPQTL